MSHKTQNQKAQTENTRQVADVFQKYAPGFSVCTVAAAIAMTVNFFAPAISPLVVAIVVGIALTNLVRLPESTAPGITFVSKKLLRLGIVFLGLQLVLGDILALGVPMLAVIICIVTGGLLGTVVMGRLLKMPTGQALLIGCGFSICGAAAVAGVEGVTDTDEEDVVTAVALVVIFGTLMIPVIPVLSQVFGLNTEHSGMLAGGSIHEIAQVVAAGGIIGGGALAVAVVVKLARVLLLAPIIAILSIRHRRSSTTTANGKRPPIVPLFIIGFLAMVILRSTVSLPDVVLDTGEFIQTALLSAAMFGLGCGVKIRNLLHVGARPFILATASTILVTGLALAGIVLVH